MRERTSRRSMLATVAGYTAARASARPGAPAETFECGTGTADITPEKGLVRDPLQAKAIAWRQGRAEAALVICDIIGIPSQLSKEVRQLAAQRTGIPAANIAVAATHTHSGGECKDQARRIVKAIESAHGALRPAGIRAGVTELPGIAFNRRFLMKDGTVRFNPGYSEGAGSFDGGFPFLNPEIVRPAGPVDPQVGILTFTEPGAITPVGAMVNFALHVCTNGGGISADFPGFLQGGMRRQIGDGFISLFGAGPCGNVNHFDAAKPGPQSGYDIGCRRIGDALAGAVLRKLPEIETCPPSLAVRSRTVQVPLQEYDEADLAWAEQATKERFAAFFGTSYNQRGFLASIRAQKLIRLAKLRRDGATYPLDVQAIRLSSGVAVVTVPGEMFVEFGIAIKRSSPFPVTLVVSLSNAILGYIPNYKAWSEGGYEVVNSFLAPGGGEQITAAAIELLRELKSA